MKKLISVVLLLSIALACFGIHAYADADYSKYVDQYVAKKGDSFVSLCKKNGLDYKEDLTAILIINGFARELSLETVQIGQTLYLPKTDEDAKAIVALHDETCPANAIEYRVKKGDTMFKICKAFHLNYNSDKETIKLLNGWQSDDELNGIEAGKTIYLPLDVPMLQIDSNIPAPIEGDWLEYYLTKHTMLPGDTFESVCEALGVNSSNHEVNGMVQSLNDDINLEKLSAGKSYFFVSANKENALYEVYSHKIVKGDTAGKLCKAYGVTFASVEDILEKLNPGMKMDSIPVGGRIHLVKTVSPSPKGTSSAPAAATAPAVVSVPVATPTAAPVAPAAGSVVSKESAGSFNGLYVERDAGKGTIEISGTDEQSVVTLLWTVSDTQKAEWTFSGTFNEAGLLMYDNCTKTTLQDNPGGTVSRSVVYRDGSGYLYVLNGVAVWHDNQEEFAIESSFAKQ